MDTLPAGPRQHSKHVSPGFSLDAINSVLAKWVGTSAAPTGSLAYSWLMRAKSLCYDGIIMKNCLCILWLAAGVLTLTASDYKIKSVKILPLESYPAQITVEGITIVADPYDTDEKSYTAFDVKKLNSQGYFPVHVIIQNTSQYFLLVRTRNIVLVTDSAQQLFTIPATVVAGDLFKGSALDKMSEASRQAPASSKVGTPLSDFSEKDLTNKLLEPGKVSDGFLFFFNPDIKKNLFSGSTLFIPKLDEEGTRKSIGPFSISLTPALSQAIKKANP
jgi:hypothetical protein